MVNPATPWAKVQAEWDPEPPTAETSRVTASSSAAVTMPSMYVAGVPVFSMRSVMPSIGSGVPAVGTQVFVPVPTVSVVDDVPPM